MEKINLIWAIILSILISIACIENINLTEDYNKLLDKHNSLIDEYNIVLKNATYDDRCIMWDVGNNIKTKSSAVNGIYFSRPEAKFYVVWIENRTFEEIELTDRHEHCHYLIEDGGLRNHFCEGE